MVPSLLSLETAGIFGNTIISASVLTLRYQVQWLFYDYLLFIFMSWGMMAYTWRVHTLSKNMPCPLQLQAVSSLIFVCVQRTILWKHKVVPHIILVDQSSIWRRFQNAQITSAAWADLRYRSDHAPPHAHLSLFMILASRVT